LELLNSIDLDVAKRLRTEGEFRREWFRAELETSVPDQIRALRELREMTQADLAEATGYNGEKPMKQSAISRFERSTDAKWELPTVLRMVEAMDGIVRVVIIPVEQAIDAIAEEEAQQASDSITEGGLAGASAPKPPLWPAQEIKGAMPLPQQPNLTDILRGQEKWNLERLIPAE
jgi:transcriptional regulator with XRE-family HTH domain